MTFAARPNGFNRAIGVQQPIGDMRPRDIESSGNGSAALLIGSQGGIVYVGNQSSGADAWYYPTTTGIGSSYWVKFTLQSGSAWDGTSIVSGTLYQLSSTRSITWTASTGTSKTAQVLVQIYSDSGGTPLVASGTAYAYSSGTGS